MRPGRLRVYLGAAPGVGKTYAMLAEGRRRAARGTRVVVGYVETHGRSGTQAQLDDLPVVPRRLLDYRGTTLEELDLEALLALAPEVALVDELAHTNAPGSVNKKRWQDVEALLAAGVDVISNVNIQHLESLNDVVASITGVRQRETVPDDIVRGAEQIELVDMTPEALRRRMAHGNIYGPETIDAALSNYFRPGNLAALRELALLWLADRVDEGLERYRRDHEISAIWPTRERVVVALTGGPEGDTLLRRGARTAARGAGGEMVAVHVSRSDGLVDIEPDALGRQRQLTAELGATYHTVAGDDVATAILDFARSVNASRIVVGASRHRPLRALFRKGIGDTIVDNAGDIDVLMVTHQYTGRRGGPPRRESPLGRNRVLWGWGMALLGTPLLTLALAASRDLHTLPTELMLYLVLAIACALVGGLFPALVCAVAGSLLLDFFFTPPLHRLTIDAPEHLFALAVFAIVAVAVSSVVDAAARRTSQAARARADADILGGMADTLLRAGDPLTALVQEVRHALNLESAALFTREQPSTPWALAASAGSNPPQTPDDGSAESTVEGTVSLVAGGRPLPASQYRLLTAFAAHAKLVLDRAALSRTAAQANELAEGNRIRTALLAAVSHDLRTPLAAIKAAVSSLRQDEIEWSPQDEADLLATVEESADRLDALLENLLDMSRLQSNTLRPLTREVGFDEVIPAAVDGTPPGLVLVELPDDAPTVRCDPGLLERVVANLVQNAVHHTPQQGHVLVTASQTSDRVQLRIADRGPGVPDESKELIFTPFQRLGDSRNQAGVGLGLSVARGLAEAMGGSVRAEDTPGGGLTMIVDLPAARGDQPARTPDLLS